MCCKSLSEHQKAAPSRRVALTNDLIKKTKREDIEVHTLGSLAGSI